MPSFFVSSTILCWDNCLCSYLSLIFYSSSYLFLAFSSSMRSWSISNFLCLSSISLWVLSCSILSYSLLLFSLSLFSSLIFFTSNFASSKFCYLSAFASFSLAGFLMGDYYDVSNTEPPFGRILDGINAVTGKRSLLRIFYSSFGFMAMFCLTFSLSISYFFILASSCWMNS